MPDDDLLSPPTTDLRAAATLGEALAELPEPAVDLLVVDRERVEKLAAAGLRVAGTEHVRWPEDPDELVVIGRADGERPVLVSAAAPTPTATALRTLGARIGRAGTGLGQVVVAVAGDDLRPLLEGLLLGGHQPVARRASGPVPGARPAGRTVVVGAAAEDLSQVATAVRAGLLARNLANAPSNVKDPQWMVERARAVAERRGLDMTVLEEDALAERGYGGLVAVGGGSVSPPRLVQLAYRPDGAKGGAPHVVLVGKGITFDTGGVNVKPAAGMLAMRTDMSGSAVVLAVIDAAAALGLPLRVTALLPLAENAIGGASYRPDDVITPYGGRRTVEITNTDAEGRLVLADALAHADIHLDPDLVVDVATLTGAARVALARSMAALFSDDDELAAGLLAAGERTGEPFWRLPLHHAYRPMLDSAVADLDNAPGQAGAITAALFLAEFVGDRRWAHLDIAGPGRSDDDTGLLSEGATGYGARALLTWLEDLT